MPKFKITQITKQAVTIVEIKDGVISGDKVHDIYQFELDEMGRYVQELSIYPKEFRDYVLEQYDKKYS